MMFARHDLAKLVGTAIAVATLGLTTPGSAAADADVDAFFRTLAANGLVFSSNRGEVLLRAQEVCAGFSAGLSPARVHAMMLDNYSAIWSPNQAAIFMASAVRLYCPRYAGLFLFS